MVAGSATQRRKMSEAAVVVVLLVLLGDCPSLVLGASPKVVNVALQPRWNHTSLLLEAGEFLAEGGSDVYWKFIETVASPRIEATDKACIEYIIHSASKHLGPFLQQSLNASLLAREFSPRIAFFESVFARATKVHEDVEEGCCAVYWQESWFNSIESIREHEGGESVATDLTEPRLYSYDHIYPDANDVKSTAILYGAPGTLCFSNWHSELKAMAHQRKLKYVHRPLQPKPAKCHELGPNGKIFDGSGISCTISGSDTKFLLSGFGVEFAIKNMEYKAIDDSTVKKSNGEEKKEDADSFGSDASAIAENEDVKGFLFAKLIERIPEKKEELMGVRDQLLSQETVEETLKIWDIKDLGLQTSRKIASSITDPLIALEDISHNFPSLASSLSRVKLDGEFEKKLLANEKTFGPGENVISVNDRVFGVDRLSIYDLLEFIRQEATLWDSLNRLHLSSKAIAQILEVDIKLDGAVKVDMRSEKYLFWYNNIQKDPVYKRWSSDVESFLRPSMFGQMPHVRKNIFHGIFVIDPASYDGARVLLRALDSVDQGLQVRTGFVYHCSSADTTCCRDVVRLFLGVKNSHGIQAAFELLRIIASYILDSEDDLSADKLADLLSELQDPESEIDLGSLIANGELEDVVTSTVLFAQSKGVTKVPLVVFNGQIIPGPECAEYLMPLVRYNFRTVQELVYLGKLKSSTDAHALFLKGAYQRYSHTILGHDVEKEYVPMIKTFEYGELYDRVKLLHKPDFEDEVVAVTHVLALNLDSEFPQAWVLLREALRYLLDFEESESRLIILYNNEMPSPTDKEVLWLLALSHIARLGFQRHLRIPALLNLVNAVIESGYSLMEEQILESTATVFGEDSKQQDKLRKALKVNESVLELLEKEIILDSQIASGLGLSRGSVGIVTNGRLVRQGDTDFVAEDLAILEELMLTMGGKSILDIVSDSQLEGVDADDQTSDFLSSLIMSANSGLLVNAELGGSREPLDFPTGAQLSSFAYFKGKESSGKEESSVKVQAVLDPLSSEAQKVSSILVFLRDVFGADITVFLNPTKELSDLPLKSYYKYALMSRFEFDEEGSLLPGPLVEFSNLPLTKTLTLHMHVPESWLVEAKVALYDLDNLRLEDLGENRAMHAIFELEALLVTGSCYDGSSATRGLQLVLETTPTPVDTIVMENLGYFQLKAQPGAWDLSIADGRSSELYQFGDMEHHEVSDTGRVAVEVGGFQGRNLKIKVQKREGKENEHLLHPDSEMDGDQDQGQKDDDSTKGFWGNLFGKKSDQGGGGAPSSIHETNGTVDSLEINIFSVASGHLYERFLRIMILSVLENTDSPVKFWFIKNYLSPKFKDIIPYMSKRYGFNYELITYKWPSFLNKQTDKIRIIWANKILFLDVLFPINLKKVIFVDADQIVRADMKELYTMDLQGRPYGYTPFCDNNKEMDGYRFWKQGFWKNHLQDRPYHISALYVVDLETFRRKAAGDILRIMYENLSKDPNSLANLDQDLPNYAQTTVPIFSLPQEWLWCESWCGNATKAAAKTIDLCNNPMTKEPKLVAARRIVPEWAAYDDEQRRFVEEVEKLIAQGIRPEDMPGLGSMAGRRILEAGLGSQSEAENHDEL